MTSPHPVAAHDDGLTTRTAWRPGARLAVGTLTVIPVGEIGPVTPAVARAAMLLAPLAALPLALCITVILWSSTALDLPPSAAGLLCVGALAGGTRAMHLDGLADTVDGFGAGWNRERALDVMKRGDVGPMGVSALFVVLGLQAVCFAHLQHAPLTAGATVVLSRCACTLLSVVGLRPARSDGLGAPMIDSVPRIASLLTTLAATALLALTLLGSAPAMRAVPAALTAVVLMCLALAWLVRRATRILGGLTGDVYGAGVELALALPLLTLSCGFWRLA